MFDAAAHVIDISPDHTHIMVYPRQMYVISVPDAHGVWVDGMQLSQLPHDAHFWMWYRNNLTMTQLLLIERAQVVQHVVVEVVHDTTTHNVSKLISALREIDERLCVGRSHWFGQTHQRTLFEQTLGMSLQSALHTLLVLMGQRVIGSWQEWQGNPPIEIRFDRVGVNGNVSVPMSYDPSVTHDLPHAYRLQLSVLLRYCRLLHDDTLNSLLVQIDRVLQHPVLSQQMLVDFIEQLMLAHQRSTQPVHSEQQFMSADVALLYERWVWAQVVLSCGIRVDVLRELLRNGLADCIEIAPHSWCAYQRRLTPVAHAAGWSRDMRVAIPDIMLWRQFEDGCYQGIIIDAKYSHSQKAPSAQAMNDVTAYLRRIGIGEADPIGAVLVHPGGGVEHWPSGVHMIGTNGFESTQIMRARTLWRQFLP